MNNIKFRPVGSPSAKVIVVRVTQSKEALCGSGRGTSKATAEKVMVRKGYVRAGGRA